MAADTPSQHSFSTRSIHNSQLRRFLYVGHRTFATITLTLPAAIVFVYDYHPNSVTLYEHHFSPKPPVMSRNGTYRPQNTQIDERTLWSYIVQIANGIKAVHSAGLAVRTIDASKILVTGKNRLRLNCCSILDVIQYGQDPTIAQLQQDDLFDFGRLVVALACSSPNAVQNLPRSLDHITRVFSADVRSVVLYLLSKSGPNKTIDELLTIAGPHLLEQFNASMKFVLCLLVCYAKPSDCVWTSYGDLLEGELMRELENGRLVRLLCKIGFINERPE
jgi:PAB-dependent poly(A)-specific ribonuclease subunit 3